MKEGLVPSFATVAFQDDDVLLVRHEEGAGHITGVYGLPSGRPEPGETEPETAAREFNEETGLTTTPGDLSEFPGNYYEATIPRKDGTTVNFSWKVFRVHRFSGELKGDEATTPEWVRIDKLDELEKQKILLPNTLNAISAALK